MTAAEWRKYCDGTMISYEELLALLRDFEAAEAEVMRLMVLATRYNDERIAAEDAAHRLEDRCVAAEEERNAAEARADAIERRGMRRQRRHRKWALKRARHWMHLFDVAGDRTMVAERRAEALEAQIAAHMDTIRLQESQAGEAAMRIEALEGCVRELLEVADLRGDADLPHPADDDKLWTARMQTAWDDLRALLSPQPEAKEEA